MDRINAPPLPSDVLTGVRPYRPPPFETPVDLRLDANEGAAPRRAIANASSSIEEIDLARYPDARPLEAEIAARLGVSPERVIVTAGADDGLERVIRAVLGPGRDLVLPTPTFEMIERYVTLAGAKAVSIPWVAGAPPIEEMARAAGPGVAAIAMVTPNSPTGLWATAQDLERLSTMCPQKVLMIDFAYSEFADDDLVEIAMRLPDAVTLFTMSKAWGLAGLRVGWAVGCPRVIGWMRAVGHPYAVSSLSLSIAAKCLKTGNDEMAAFVEAVRSQRARLAGLLDSLGAEVWPSRANFVLARFAKASLVRTRLAEAGIAVRAFPENALLEGCLRITLPGNDKDFQRLTEALRRALGAKEEGTRDGR